MRKTFDDYLQSIDESYGYKQSPNDIKNLIISDLDAIFDIPTLMEIQTFVNERTMASSGYSGSEGGD